MKNPYTQEKLQAMYNGIADAKLEKNKKSYTIWGIVCIVLIHPICLAIGAFLLWRSYLISKELSRRNAVNAHVVAPAPSTYQKAQTDPQQAELPHYVFDDGTKLFLEDVELQNFDIIKTYHTKVVGVTYENDNGTSRQEYLEYNAHPGHPIGFREFVYDGKPAYAVHLERGQQIGNLKESLAGDISDFMDSHEKELFMYGEITEITGGDDGMKYGCNIVVYLLARK